MKNRWPAHIIFDIGGVLYEQISSSTIQELPGLAILEQCYSQRDEHHQRLHKLYILSNCPAESFALLIKHYPNFTNYFDGMMFAHQLPFKKPQAQIYQECLTAYAINPAEAIFIDDLAINVTAAEALGITGIHHTSTERSLGILRKLGVL